MVHALQELTVSRGTAWQLLSGHHAVGAGRQRKPGGNTTGLRLGGGNLGWLLEELTLLLCSEGWTANQWTTEETDFSFLPREIQKLNSLGKGKLLIAIFTLELFGINHIISLDKIFVCLMVENLREREKKEIPLIPLPSNSPVVVIFYLQFSFCVCLGIYTHYMLSTLCKLQSFLPPLFSTGL